MFGGRGLITMFGDEVIGLVHHGRKQSGFQAAGNKETASGFSSRGGGDKD